MHMLDKIILIHPTKCAGTTISEKLFKLKGLSDKRSAFYSGYSFNRFFQKNIQFFYFVIHSRALIIYPFYLLFYIICIYYTIRNFFCKHKLGLTFKDGSIQHFTYKQWKQINQIKKVSKGVSKSKGKWLCLLDGDDFFDKKNYNLFIITIILARRN